MEHSELIDTFYAWYHALRPVIIDECRRRREREEAMAFYREKRRAKARYRRRHGLFAIYERNEFAD